MHGNEHEEQKERVDPGVIAAIAADALVPVAGGEAAARDWLALRRIVNDIERSLAEGLPVESVLGVRYRRSVQILFTGKSERLASADAKFGFRIALGGDAVATVVLDQRAAEGIASVFVPLYAPIRGYGDPTRVETALLEFATLQTLAELHRESIGVVGAAGLQSFLKRAELASGDTLRGHPLEMRVIVDHLEGRANLWLPNGYLRPVRRVLPPAPRSEVAGRGRTSVEVFLALPAFDITPLEWAAADLGDVLLTGATTLDSFGANCSLVTATHWRLSHATIEIDTPTSVGVRVGRLEPIVFSPMASPRAVAGSALLQPLLGVSRLTHDQLENWTAGARLDLAKSTSAGVSICCEGAEIARGELVSVSGEVGVRLTAIYSKQIGEEAP